MIDRWPHPACLDDEALLRQCELGRGRAGGPGGQHRNKVETLVMIRHVPSGLEAHAGERRSQSENKGVALKRLRLLLAIEVRCDPPRARGLDEIVGPSGSALWRSRRRDGRVACNPEHRDFPALLAEALDVVAAAEWDAPPAAERLEVTTSQLVKLVKDCPAALLAWNRKRRERGMRELK
ncbi:MAG: peptide chain release factor-like protein [Phycisphaerales bacterium]